MTTPVILGSILAYTGLLFLIAFRADRRGDARAQSGAIVYGLSIAVYCTSWTFYGAVGTAGARGWEYLPIYLGPALVFTLGLPVVSRLVRTGKRINTTSIADFLSAHYGRSRMIAVIVALIAIVGSLPYIALQLSSVSATFIYLGGLRADAGAEISAIFITAVMLAAFGILFGARHADITRHNRGLIAAIAFDSVIKLIALLAVGAFAFGLLSMTPSDRPAAEGLSSAPIDVPRFVVLTILSMAAVLCLPRQFHVTVVEAQGPRRLLPASILFVLYLAVISALVIPISLAGRGEPRLIDVPTDLHVLALPLSLGAEGLALLVFVGGFAAATGMVIVASVALSTMVANDLAAPIILRSHAGRDASDLGARLLFVRRASILCLLMIAAIFAALAPKDGQLASLGILSFAAAAQFAPALLGALYWRRASRPGAAAGMLVGFALWTACLFVPVFAPGLGVDRLLTGWLDLFGWDSFTRGAILSIGANAIVFAAASLFAGRAERETRQPETGGVAAGALYKLIERCIGEAAAADSIGRFEQARGFRRDPTRPADASLVAFADQQISGALGASSARILLRSVLAGESLQLDDVATLIAETTGRASFSQEILQTTIENITHGISVIDADMRLVAWNSAYLKLYDYPEGFITEGKPIADVIRFNAERGECGPGEIDTLVDRRVAHLRRGDRHKIERTRPNGAVIKIEGMRSPSGAYVTTFTDVSDYKRIEKALTDSERSIRFYTDNMPAMVAFADQDERIRFANNAYRIAFGIGEDDIGVKRLCDIMPAADYADRRPYIHRALKGERVTFDIETPGDGGEPCYIQVAYAPQFRADGAVRGFFGLYQDVTARRRAEEELARNNESLEERVADRTAALSSLNVALDAARRQAEDATASKTRFLAAASHDVLQPLNAARLFASALKESAQDPEETKEIVARIDASIASADRLLRSLLNISKLDAGGVAPEFSDFPLQDLFQEVANEFALAARHRGLRFHTAPTSVWVRSDRGLLLSALQNLVANAVRYTDAGSVLIGARRLGAGRIRIEVVDTGPGIPPESLQEVFVEFRRLDRDAARAGAGLGLATVDRIARLLSHEVGVRSTPGKGSTFSLVIPRAEQRENAAQGQRAAMPGGDIAGKRVVCIDNDPRVLDAMTTLLRRWGAEVLAYSDDRDLVAAETNATLPDYLLLDYQLDGGRTGFDALAALSAHWGAAPPTVMITASSSGEAESKASALGVPVLAKPVEAAELRATLNNLRTRAAE